MVHPAFDIDTMLYVIVPYPSAFRPSSLSDLWARRLFRYSLRHPVGHTSMPQPPLGIKMAGINLVPFCPNFYIYNPLEFVFSNKTEYMTSNQNAEYQIQNQNEIDLSAILIIFAYLVVHWNIPYFKKGTSRFRVGTVLLYLIHPAFGHSLSPTFGLISYSTARFDSPQHVHPCQNHQSLPIIPYVSRLFRINA